MKIKHSMVNQHQQLRVGKKIVLIIVALLVLFTKYSYSQDCFTWIKNEKLHFKFGYISPDFDAVSNTYDPSKYIVIIDLDSIHVQCIKNYSYDFWMNLLKDSASDFAANLLLYSLTEKNAVFLHDTTRKSWLLSGKDDDLKYWAEYLKKELPR